MNVADTNGPPTKLTKAILAVGVRYLTDRDPRLAQIVEQHGPPPLWARPQGFATLVQIILEQQVSLASAAAMFRRLETKSRGEVTPASMTTMGVQRLQALGVTRQKARYVCAIADEIRRGRFSLNTLGRLPDDEAADRLMGLPGIGPWTANIYLLMALRRPNVWPAGDLALHRSLTHLHGRVEPFTTEEAQVAADEWRPWRAVAARILWHDYLSRKTARA